MDYLLFSSKLKKMIKLRTTFILLELFVLIVFSYSIYLDWGLFEGVPLEGHSTELLIDEDASSQVLFRDIFKFCLSFIIAYLAWIF